MADREARIVHTLQWRKADRRPLHMRDRRWKWRLHSDVFAYRYAFLVIKSDATSN